MEGLNRLMEYALKAARDPHHVLETNPTAEAIAKLIFDSAVSQGYPVTAVRLWETPHSFATYYAD